MDKIFGSISKINEELLQKTTKVKYHFFFSRIQLYSFYYKNNKFKNKK